MSSFLVVLMSSMLTIFGISWLMHQFMSLMGLADTNEVDIQPVEVVNFGDFGRK